MTKEQIRIQRLEVQVEKLQEHLRLLTDLTFDLSQEAESQDVDASHIRGQLLTLGVIVL